jgi:CheY-like chemotaxis protein
MRLKGKRIYIADDDENVLYVVTAMLEREGAKVVAGINGRKMFTAVSFGDPDCIISDLYMPLTDGFDTIEAIKDFLPVDCPILVLTGYPTEENIARALESGATECLAKPVKPEELIDTVVRLIDDSSC